jgi:alpha-L-fucosidase
VTAEKVRLRIVSAAASPIVAEFGLYLLPDMIEEPSIERDAQGVVTLHAHGTGIALFYTVDGQPPTSSSQRYTEPFSLPGAATVRAIAKRAEGGSTSAIVSRDFDVAPKNWRVIAATGDKPDNLIKGGPFFGNAHAPVTIVIDLGQAHALRGFTLTPVSEAEMNDATVPDAAPPASFTAWVGDDGRNWGEPAGQGEFANIAANRSAQVIRFAMPRSGRYLRLELPRAVQESSVVAIGGIGVLTR